MINIKLSQIYNNKPYYKITKGKESYSAFGAEQAIKIIRDIRRNKEKVKIRNINPILEEHNKLLGLLKSENK